MEKRDILQEYQDKLFILETTLKTKESKLQIMFLETLIKHYKEFIEDIKYLKNNV